MDIKELQKLVFDAGIVGAGGAGFPTHQKFSGGIKQIVVNAAECEPLMMVDHHILAMHFKSSVATLRDLIAIIGADEAIIGIKGKNMHLLDAQIVAELEGSNIKIKEIPDVYPAGDEVVLVYETTGKIIPEGSIPVMVGVMVINTETLYNIHQAMHEKTPVVEKYVTIGGDVERDVTVKVPVGMKISELFAELGYTDLEGKAVINGGPMMGKLVDLEQDVVTKTTKGLLVFPETHSIIQRRRASMSMTLKRASAACCNCTMCTDVCPRHLLGYSIEPHKILYTAAHSKVLDTESFLQSSLCCGCGVCTVIGCQQMLDPQAIAMETKRLLAKNGYKRTNNKAPEQPLAERANRLIPSETLIDRLGIRKYVKPKVQRDYIKFTPQYVYIPLSQHVGKPAAPVVAVGDAVKIGDAIARTEAGALGTTMHASINGVVQAVDSRQITIRRA